jgi:hypothetical protein
MSSSGSSPRFDVGVVKSMKGILEQLRTNARAKVAVCLAAVTLVLLLIAAPVIVDVALRGGRLSLSPAISARFAERSTLSAFKVYDNGANAGGMRIQNGLLVHGPPIRAPAASYLEVELSNNISTIGAEAVFSEPSGAVALVVWQRSVVEAWQNRSELSFPRAGLHFVAYPNGWHLGVYTGDSEDIIKTVTYSRPLVTDGRTRYRFELRKRGDDAWVDDPISGESEVIREPRIAEWAGPWACWELYEHTTNLKPAAFASVWAN